jgi:hypothetical protein
MRKEGKMKTEWKEGRQECRKLISCKAENVEEGRNLGQWGWGRKETWR